MKLLTALVLVGLLSGNAFAERTAVNACFEATKGGYNYVVFTPVKDGWKTEVFSKGEKAPYVTGYAETTDLSYTRYFPMGESEGPYKDIKPDHTKPWPCPEPGNVKVSD